jgi:hypothetical protein
MRACARPLPRRDGALPGRDVARCCAPDAPARCAMQPSGLHASMLIAPPVRVWAMPSSPADADPVAPFAGKDRFSAEPASRPIVALSTDRWRSPAWSIVRHVFLLGCALFPRARTRLLASMALCPAPCRVLPVQSSLFPAYKPPPLLRARTSPREAHAARRTSLLAIHEKRPRTRPEMTPTIGPVTSIMTRGAIGMRVIIAASFACVAMY